MYNELNEDLKWLMTVWGLMILVPHNDTYIFIHLYELELKSVK